MGTIMWGPETAAAYDQSAASMYEPGVLDPMVAVLTELAHGGRALEFAVGTGRVALALSRAGVDVSGIELSPHMVEQMRSKQGSEAVPVTIGDMTTTRVPGQFSLVYLVFNTIMNVTDQSEQVDVFANAASHLEPGGAFVIEVIVPQLRRLSPGEVGRVFSMQPDHVGIETFDDPVGQISWSHHWMQVAGRLVHNSAPYRYVWPPELDLMARLAGLSLENRWAGWGRDEFTAASTSHVSVWRMAG